MSETEEAPSKFLTRPITDTRWRIPKRYVQSILSYLGLFIVSWMSCNFGVVQIYKLLNHRKSDDNLSLETASWTVEEIEYGLSAFYWSYACAQIPCSLLVIRFPANKILGTSVALTTVLHMIIPLTLNNLPGAFIIRLLRGIAEGPLYAANIAIWRSWAPSGERTRLVAFGFSGVFFGESVGTPLSTLLVEKFGEVVPFCASGVAGLIWCALWFSFTSESPSTHPSISHYELMYLEENTTDSPKRNDTVKSVPWKAMLRSKPIWAICVANFVYSCCYYACLLAPFLHMKIISVSDWSHILLMASPNLIIAIIIPLGSLLADHIINKKYITANVLRKIFCSGAFVLHAIFILVVAFNTNSILGFVSLSIASGMLGISIIGFLVNCMDLSPRYSCLVLSLANTCGAIGSIILPSIIEHLIQSLELSEWQKVFFITCGLSLAGSLAYGFMSSSQLQSWDNSHDIGIGATQGNSSGSTYYPHDHEDEQCVLDTVA